MRHRELAGPLIAVLIVCQWGWAGTALAQVGLQVEDTGGEPAKRVITVTSPGVYKAEVWQANSGGISRFYDLSADPEAKRNLAKALFEVGWHGAWHVSTKGPDGKVEEKKVGGALWWPWRGVPEETGLQIVESTPARVRVHVDSVFVPYKSSDKGAKVDCTYTFYPTGRIAVRMHISKTGPTFHWGGEYGPHLMVLGDDKNPDADCGFEWSTPTSGKIEREHAPAKSEELALGVSGKTRTSLMLTIPPEENSLFTRHMRHNGRSIGWDRFGYGSAGVVMTPGYDSTWACLIQMGTPGNHMLPELGTAKDALPFALDYREPAKIAGATLVTDDAGDFNKDGFNESEGCHVLTGPGPLSFTYERGKGAGFAPVFKVVGWKGEAPKSVVVDGKAVEALSAVVDGKLVLQVMGTLSGEKVKVQIGG